MTRRSRNFSLLNHNPFETRNLTLVISRLGILTVLLLAACSTSPLPEVNSPDYREAVTSFYSSVASVQSGEDVGAEGNLMRVAELAPGEPAVWYNLGLLSLRQNKFDEGRERLLQAEMLAPENNEILRLIGIMEITQGNINEGIGYLEKSAAQEPLDYKSRFALAQELIRTGEPAQLSRAAELYEQLASDLPENLVVQLEKARLAAQIGNTDAVKEASDVLEVYASEWDEEIQEPFIALQAAAEEEDVVQARVQSGFLRNMLLSTYNFRQDLLAVQTPTEEVGDLMTQFVLLEPPSSQPAAADMQLSYNTAPIENASNVKQVEVVAVNGDGGAKLGFVTENAVTIGQQSFERGASRFVAIDYNYDFLVDLALVGADGVQILEQDSTGAFSATGADMFEGSTGSSAYSNVWVADIDLEGDLDLVLATEAGALVLRNNGDGTFASRSPFSDVGQLVDFAWGDFDGDGDPDPALLDTAGELYLYSNERLGAFTREIVPPIFGSAVALAVGDPDADALMDLVVLMDNGAVYSLANHPGEGWVVAQLVQWDGYSSPQSTPPGLFLADFDNNGAVDVLVAGEESSVWLQTGPATFEAIDAPIPGTVQSISDTNEDGILDLVGLEDGEIRQWAGAGTQDYHWQILRPRAGQALGDQRINSFTIGGEVEIRAGLLYQKQPIRSPTVHLGLGTHEKTDVARLIWPNGDIQSEFDLAADQSIFTPQRLKGSCPWLFTFDGEEMRFVTDFIWRSPLGLRINAQETAGTVTTEDWVKIRGEELAPRDGVYDLRITAELWETHFFDHVSLLAVDHPEDTEIFIDERFGFPPPEMKVHHTSTVKPVTRVLTDDGADVTATINTRDADYLDFFGRGDYQGITRDHYVDIDLPEEVMDVAHPMLVAFGWVRPTDSSINVAISQGSQAAPRGLSLEVKQKDGSWRIVRDDLGFPAGKTKTVLIDLAGAFDERAEPIVRLRSNLEVYWDHIGWTEASEQGLNTQRVPLRSANLQYRGFSRVRAANASSPELPDYQELAGTQARWRDLIGFYTRFGDVEELLETTDDRYVIMNAGDEMRFLFEALPAPPPGMRRDFVLVGDGWVKDGDYNTAFSKTVLPLPTHQSPAYDTPPSTLSNDPVYKQHAQDWQTYHTRYVAPDRFREALAGK